MRNAHVPMSHQGRHTDGGVVALAVIVRLFISKILLSETLQRGDKKFKFLF